jgi:putative transposase
MNSPLVKHEVHLRGLRPPALARNPGFHACMGINHSSRAEVYVHLVWATWDRQPLLVAGIREQVHRAIWAEASRLGAQMFAVGGVEDHVHVLIRIPATVSLAQMVKQLKGSSSHLTNHELLHGGFKWQGGYGAFSVAERALPRVRDYVLRQEEHHRDGTIHPAAEL